MRNLVFVWACLSYVNDGRRTRELLKQLHVRSTKERHETLEVTEIVDGPANIDLLKVVAVLLREGNATDAFKISTLRGRLSASKPNFAAMHPPILRSKGIRSRFIAGFTKMSEKQAVQESTLNLTTRTSQRKGFGTFTAKASQRRRPQQKGETKSLRRENGDAKTVVETPRHNMSQKEQRHQALKLEKDLISQAEDSEQEAMPNVEEERRAKDQAEEELGFKAEEQASTKAEEETRLKAEEEARLKAGEEARSNAEVEIRSQREEAAEAKADDEASLKEEENAAAKAEEARLKIEQEVGTKVDEKEYAQVQAMEEAGLKEDEETKTGKIEQEGMAKVEEDALLQAEWEEIEQEAIANAEEDALLQTERKEETGLKEEEEEEEKEARTKAEDAGVKAGDDTRSEAGLEPRAKAEVKAWPQRDEEPLGDDEAKAEAEEEKEEDEEDEEEEVRMEDKEDTAAKVDEARLMPRKKRLGKRQRMRRKQWLEAEKEARANASENVPANISETMSEGRRRRSSRRGSDEARQGSRAGNRGGLKALSEFEVGAEVEGTVLRIHHWAAFLDIGAANDAKLHVSDASEQPIVNLTQHFSLGDIVKCRVKRFDLERNQVALTCKNLENRTALEELEVGAEFEGNVRYLRPFGAFIDIGAVKDGLLHNSDVLDRFVKNAFKEFSLGETVRCKIKEINLENQQMKLTAGVKKTPLEELEIGAEVEGEVKYLHPVGVVVDIGASVGAFLHIGEVHGLSEKDLRGKFKVGDKVKSRIKSVVPEAQRIKLTCRKSLAELQPGTEVEGKVVNLEKFGAFLDIGAFRNALLLRSEVRKIFQRMSIGDTVKCKIKTVNLNPERITVGDDARTPISKIEVGSEVVGKVVGLKEYGAFLNIGATKNALLHHFEMSNDHTEDVSQKFSVGDVVKCRVKGVDFEKDTVALTIRDERTALEDLEVGSEVYGKICSVSKWGAFVHIGAVDLGFIHISDISDEPVDDVRNRFYVGEIIKCRIKSINMKDEKFTLTCRQQDVSEERIPLQELEVGSKVEGKVVRREIYGVFVDIGARLDGLLHISEIPNGRSRESIKKFTLGKIVECHIKKVDLRLQRFYLTCRTAEPIPLRELVVGEEVEGQVVRKDLYGVFLDIGATETALLHMEEMTGAIKDNFSKISSGDTITCRIMDVDLKTKRTWLTCKEPVTAPVGDFSEFSAEEMLAQPAELAAKASADSPAEALAATPEDEPAAASPSDEEAASPAEDAAPPVEEAAAPPAAEASLSDADWLDDLLADFSVDDKQQVVQSEAEAEAEDGVGTNEDSASSESKPREGSTLSERETGEDSALSESGAEEVPQDSNVSHAWSYDRW